MDTGKPLRATRNVRSLLSRDSARGSATTLSDRTLPASLPSKFLFSSFLLSATLLLTACQGAPPCLSPEKPMAPANAGCLITQGKSMLAIEQHTGKWGPPGGTSEPPEPAQCTAQRETWEETGFTVKATHLIHVFENGFHLFACDIVGDTRINAPNDQIEVKNIDWLDSEKFDRYEWRFPNQVQQLKHYIEQKNHHKAE